MKDDTCPICTRTMRVADDARALACGNCIQRLLQLSGEQKLEQIAELRARGRDQAAEAIEKFSGLGRHAKTKAPKKPNNVLLVEFRKARDLTQEELATEWGIPRQYVYQMESDKRPVPERFLSKMKATP